MDSSFYRKLDKHLGLRAGAKRLARNKLAMIAILGMAVLGGYFLFGNHGILQRVRLQEQKAELERKIHDAEEETKALRQQSQALDSDRKAIEKVARERYGMVREGEKVYKVNRDENRSR